MEIIHSKRSISNQQEQGRFCPCGEPATHSCTDSVQNGSEGWIESAERYGCRIHPVESVIYFTDGTSMTAKQYEETKWQ